MLMDFLLLSGAKLFLFLFLGEQIVEEVLRVDESMAFVMGLDVVECLHQLHFTLGVVSPRL